MSCGVPHVPALVWGLWYHHEVAYQPTSADFWVLRGWCVCAGMEEDLTVSQLLPVMYQRDMVQAVSVRSAGIAQAMKPE